MRPSHLVASVSTLALAATLSAGPAQAHSKAPETVADGLAGPLTLALGSGGSTYVTESFAGRLTKVSKKGELRTVYQAPAPGIEVVGVDVDGKDIYHIETDFAAETSHIVKTSRSGKRTVVSDDFIAHEEEHNPDARKRYGLTSLDASCAELMEPVEEALGFPLVRYRGVVESHAYQIEVTKKKIYVADAAANAVLSVNRRNGDISTVAVLPSSPITVDEDLRAALEDMLPEGEKPVTVPKCIVGEEYVPEPVPTDVKVDRKGRLYVTTLEGGAGELMPLSKVYRIDQKSGRAKVLVDDLFGATGLDRTRDGTLYVAEMFGGEVSVVPAGRSTAKTLFTADAPADVEVSRRHVYATTDVFGEGALVKYHHRGHR